MIVLAGFAFVAGIITILSPCILPVLPVILAGGTGGGKARPVGIILGFILSFTVFTVTLSAIAEATGLGTGALRIFAVVILALFGLVMLVPKLSQLFEAAISRLTTRFQPKQGSKNGFWGGIPLGMSLGILWTPCVGPILASVITLALASSIDAGAFVITLAYSLGTAIPMFLIMIGGRALIKRVPALTKHSGGIRRGFGVVMIFVSLSIAMGWDVQFQSAVLNAFPGYGSNLTALENTEAVNQAIRERENQLLKENQTYTEDGVFTGVNTDLSQEGVSGKYGQAPQLIAQGPWINSPPLTMDSLKGRVVLIDFWTYSCINCIRTIPYLQSWHEKYKDFGLTLIGVHSPEFAFERQLENVQKAVEDLNVTWPVVLDNNFAQWRSYNNRYWPAHFLIDASGEVRYFTFGEGDYQETEMMIQSLLIEAGYSPPTPLGLEKDQRYAATGEIYLGTRRVESFQGSPELKNGSQNYTPAPALSPHHWTLEGEWTLGPEYAQANGSNSRLHLSYEAKTVYAVLAPPDDGPTELSLTGQGVNQTILIDTSRMYQLADFSRQGKHTLELNLPPGMKIYTFTFGG
jgi:cytochrome c biogenesis protein CcdA/thiol-disulfide isomerase/thioredoxin